MKRLTLTTLLFLLATVSLGAAEQKQKSSDQPSSQPADALSVIEGVRGGRHWVDQKTAAAKSPSESLACLEIEEGFELTLVAAEPIVIDPVAIAFDHRGRMFVVEYGDYPIGPEDGGKPLSRVVLLQDSDGDGKMDRRTVFADQLDFAHSLMPWKDGILVGAKTQLLFLRDVDGDDVADERTSLFVGFTPAHPQMQIGNPRWGIDNWIYCNYGPGKITRPGVDTAPVTMPRKDLRFDPVTMTMEPDGGLGQFGNTVDRWGNRFYCTNRNPIMMTMLPTSVLQRNPFLATTKVHDDVGKSGGDTRVYPLVAMKSNYLSHAGTHTSACGVTANLGDQLGPSSRSSVFVCEPIGHLVTRSIVEQSGAGLKARRAQEKKDFLASTDTWFRPASLATGPDGAMYLADMYRLWVEHPKFLPKEIADRLDWRAGDNRGRIYRISQTGAKPSSFATPATGSDCVDLMRSDNGWRQFLGQRLLVEQQDKSVVAGLRDLLTSGKLETTRLHALWTLDGLGSLSVDDILTGMDDKDSYVRRDAARLAGKHLDDPSILGQLVKLAGDDNPRVRFQTLLTLGDSGDDEATAAIASIAARDGGDPWFALALLTAVGQRSGVVLQSVIQNGERLATGNAAAIHLVQQLASVAASRGNVTELQMVMGLLDADESEGGWWRSAIVSGIGKGLLRHRGVLGRTNLASLLREPPKDLAESAESIRELLKNNRQVTMDPSKAIADRVAAIELLSYEPIGQARSTFEELLSNHQPAEVQNAAIKALSGNGSLDAAKIVLARWPQLGPSVRGAALSLLLRRVESTRLALDAMAAGTMRPAALSIDERVRLLKHSDVSIRKAATALLGGAVSANRREVAQKYAAAIEMHGSAQAGYQVFRRVCANCHRVNGQGHDTGPDLSDVRNRSPLALLYDIMDPNAKVEPRFTAYSIVTLDGKVLNGLIASETSDAIGLKMAEGKLQIVQRDEIEQLKVSTVSLMPEGIEKDVTIQQMSDLLEFLMHPSGVDTSTLSLGASPGGTSE